MAAARAQMRACRPASPPIAEVACGGQDLPDRRLLRRAVRRQRRQLSLGSSSCASSADTTSVWDLRPAGIVTVPSSRRYGAYPGVGQSAQQVAVAGSRPLLRPLAIKQAGEASPSLVQRGCRMDWLRNGKDSGKWADPGPPRRPAQAAGRFDH